MGGRYLKTEEYPESNPVIERTMRIAAANLHYALKDAFPARNDQCDIHEQNLIHQTAQAHMSWRPEASAFCEVPFQKGSQTAKTRYDLFIHDSDNREGALGIVAEAKMVEFGTLDSLLDDKKRLDWPHIACMLRLCRPDRVSLNRLFRMLIATTWKKEVADWWCQPAPSNYSGLHRELLHGMFTETVVVIRYPEGSVLEPKARTSDTLHLLWAYDEQGKKLVNSP